MLYKTIKNVKHKTSFGNSKHVKKILGLQDPPDPTAVFYCSHFGLALWETQSSTQKTARALSA